jgi:hypothetical protein
MPNYKDTQNKLHWLDDEAHEHLLPVGSVRITDVEDQEIRAAEVAPVVEAPTVDPVDKLKAFLASNPDVAELL